MLCDIKVKRFRANRVRRGAILPLVIFVAVLIVMVGGSILALSVHSQTFSTRAAQQVRARAAADAGVTHALLCMNNKLAGGPWSDASLPQLTNQSLPNTNATFSYSVSGSQAAGYTVTSTGTFAPFSKTINATVRLKGLFDTAILVGNKLELGNNTVVDAYNSADSHDTHCDVQIGTLSTTPGSIDLGTTAVINADVFVGVDSDPASVISGSGAINGFAYPLDEPIGFENIVAPVLPNKGVLNITDDTELGPADSGQYDSITIDNNETLTIEDGDVVLHVTGDIVMGNKSDLVIESGATLTLYVDGDIDAGNSDGIGNENTLPSAFKLFSTGSPVQHWELKNKTDMFGVIYAPDACVEVWNSGDICGSVAADTFIMKNNGTFLYDEALRTVTVTDPGAEFTIRYWSE